MAIVGVYGSLQSRRFGRVRTNAHWVTGEYRKRRDDGSLLTDGVSMKDGTQTRWSLNGGAGSTTVLENGQFAADCNSGYRPDDHVRAAFIVRACNSHDDLVAAAKVALEQYRKYLYVDGLPEDGRAFDALEAAITKATP